MRARAQAQDLRGKIPDTISIRERPAEAEDRAIPGHWEGDLLCGTKSSQIITLVERHSRYTALIKVADHKTENVLAALTRHVRSLPKSLCRSRDLGSRQGDVPARELLGGHGREGVLL